MSTRAATKGVQAKRVRPATAAWCAALALGLLLASVPAAGPAYAQSDELRPLLDRLDRLERDLNLLQRQVYRGKIEAGDGALTPGAAGSPATSGGSSNAVADMEIRLNALESQMRGMTGNIEEVKHSVDQVSARLDKLVADVDARLTAMEQNVAKAKGGNAAMAAGAPAPETDSAGTAAAVTPPGAGKGDMALAAPSTAAAAAPGAANAAAGASGAAAAPGTAGSETLPQGTPMEQYQYARAQLAKADYPGAEKTLKAFISTYPDNELTENAEYWLGETYYVRSDYRNAAITYADALKKYPKGPKAPDNMLKLGLSFAKMGDACKANRTDECKNVAFADNACKVFADIPRKFPNARADIRDRAEAERKQRGCK